MLLPGVLHNLNPAISQSGFLNAPNIYGTALADDTANSARSSISSAGLRVPSTTVAGRPPVLVTLHTSNY